MPLYSSAQKDKMTSTLLTNHLEQISLCAASISELEFPGPKMFTNALLAPHDITALIRDTEIHERALFSIVPPPVPSKSQVQQFTNSISGSTSSATRNNAAINAPRQPKRNTAVASVLGGELYRRVKDAAGGTDAGKGMEDARLRAKGDLDVDVLLEGAEKLCNVYPVAGSTEMIAGLRERYQHLSANIAHYEDRVARNAKQLDMMSQRTGYDGLDLEREGLTDPETPAPAPSMTKEDLAQEEHEIRDLERKKRGLEERVTGMERDLGGLMR